jgi:hypothetical protein
MLLVCLTAGLVGACLSPTLPLPPPSPPDTILATEQQGVYQLKGAVRANSLVTAFNIDNGLSFGQRTEGDGRYDFLVRGKEGDRLELWYSVGTDESNSVSFELEPR